MRRCRRGALPPGPVPPPAAGVPGRCKAPVGVGGGIGTCGWRVRPTHSPPRAADALLPPPSPAAAERAARGAGARKTGCPPPLSHPALAGASAAGSCREALAIRGGEAFERAAGPLLAQRVCRAVPCLHPHPLVQNTQPGFTPPLPGSLTFSFSAREIGDQSYALGHGRGPLQAGHF